MSGSPQMMVVGGSPSRRRRGRPPRALVRATERIEIRVTADERKGLERMARDNGQPLATVVRDAVNEFVADYSERRIFGTTAQKPE